MLDDNLCKCRQNTEIHSVQIFMGRYEEKRKYRPIAWDKAKTPIHLSGLGLRSLVKINIALQGETTVAIYE